MPKLPELVAGLAPVVEYIPSPWLVFTLTDNPNNLEKQRGARCAFAKERVEILAEKEGLTTVHVVGHKTPFYVAESLDELLAQ